MNLKMEPAANLQRPCSWPEMAASPRLSSLCTARLQEMVQREKNSCVVFRFLSFAWKPGKLPLLIQSCTTCSLKLSAVSYSIGRAQIFWFLRWLCWFSALTALHRTRSSVHRFTTCSAACVQQWHCSSRLHKGKEVLVAVTSPNRAVALDH